MNNPERLETPNPAERRPRQVQQVDPRVARALGDASIRATERQDRAERMSREVGRRAVRGVSRGR